MSDNTTTVAAINKQGSIRSKKINQLSRLIWLFAIENELWLSAAHCPGAINTEADRASGQFSDGTEWTLEYSIFSAICGRYGTPNIDLFAARNNHKVAKYCAWQPDPGAVFIDAFQYHWGQDELLYIFPPFSLIGAVLQKLVMDEGTAILIIPFWEPWFTQVAWLLADKPTTVYSSVYPLYSWQGENTSDGRETDPACLVSGKSSVAQEFRKGLQPQSKTPHDTPRGHCAGLISDYGINFVCQSKLIPCTPLPWM